VDSKHAAEQMQLDLKHLQKLEAGQLNVTLSRSSASVPGSEW
jgi:hypothetical protein